MIPCKITTLVLITSLTLLIGLIACTKSNPDPAVNTDLTGTWAGPNGTKQAGNCSWSGDPSVSALVTLQVANNVVTGTLVRGSASAKPISGTVTGNVLRIIENNSVTCNGVSGSYLSRYEGSLSGTTLTLTSHDTLCPIPGCIFLRTLTLTRK